MKEHLMEWWVLLTSLEFWEEALSIFRNLGIAFPILLTAMESIISPLPLVAIVTLNVAAYGPFFGAFYSWIGTCLGCTLTFYFWRKVLGSRVGRAAGHHKKLAQARAWVEDVRGPGLFLIAMMPFTPSAFLNFAFGVSEYDGKKYLKVVYGAKSAMIILLALLGESFVQATKNPLFIILVIVLFLALYYVSKKINKKYQTKDSNNATDNVE